MPSIPTPAFSTMRRPKNKNKVKLKALDRGATTVTAAAVAVDVHHSTWYRWECQESVITPAAQDAPNKYYTSRSKSMYIRNPELEKKLLAWIVEMRKNRYLCVSMECLLLMMARYDPEHFKMRTRDGNISYLKRFFKAQSPVNPTDPAQG
ncbi:hypothetical protein P3T76_009530 [Phytophthora citrophthora]|uniref:Uncharacterized protein n=1 Tax=Phytophthora citrophthora TaxID=4793 RepID=A0AAD9LID4_9STRA|nr:hypothetical protein P3T76_009530 [Phytophthora citrophthora]